MLDLETRISYGLTKKEKEKIDVFLKKHDLIFEGNPECTVYLEDEEENVAATASIQGNVIKMVAADTEWREAGLTGYLISFLLSYARERGLYHLFVFTKPDITEKFAFLGFKAIAATEDVVLMETGRPSAVDYIKHIEKFRDRDGVFGAAVMNCNPFTKGHRYLIENAARSVAGFYVIVVREDLSVFPFADRIKLVKAGTADLANVIVLSSSDYAVSRATFPAYFLKSSEKSYVTQRQAELDVALFINIYAKPLSISKRFVGTEPFCPTTNIYNATMRKMLPHAGIEFVEIQRVKSADGIEISASRVREALKNGELNAIEGLIPAVTSEYLKSVQGMKVVEKLRQKHDTA